MNSLTRLRPQKRHFWLKKGYFSNNHPKTQVRVLRTGWEPHKCTNSIFTMILPAWCATFKCCFERNFAKCTELENWKRPPMFTCEKSEPQIFFILHHDLKQSSACLEQMLKKRQGKSSQFLKSILTMNLHTFETKN